MEDFTKNCFNHFNFHLDRTLLTTTSHNLNFILDCGNTFTRFCSSIHYIAQRFSMISYVCANLDTEPFLNIKNLFIPPVHPWRVCERRVTFYCLVLIHFERCNGRKWPILWEHNPKIQHSQHQSSLLDTIPSPQPNSLRLILIFSS
jgi:hypothetical protein